MNSSFNEFLRVQTFILIILLVIQGLDYIFGFGVNNYVFLVFCIVFAFTLGSIYHNIITIEGDERNNVSDIEAVDVDKYFTEESEVVDDEGFVQ